MNSLKSVLVILDKPRHKQVALQRAKAIQKATGAHLTVVSFVWLPMAEEKEVFDVHQRRSLKQTCVAERQDWLRGLVLDNKLSAADVSTKVVWTNDIAGWVTNETRESECDLVIKTVHHSKTALHTPLDWRLLSECRPPLLLASGRVKRSAGNVLATVDLRSSDRKHTRLNQRVLDAAQCFAEINDADLHVVNAVEFGVMLRDLDFPNLRQLQKKGRDAAKQALQKMLTPYGVPGRKQHMQTGKVGQVVADTVDKVDANLVVLGTSAHRHLGKVLIGGSAEKILARTTCDVLAVHPN